MNALPVVIEEVAISDEGTALQSKEDNEAKTQRVWESCCFRIDIGCASFITQTIVGVALLAFACYMIKTETNAERQYPYWGLIGTMCGFVFVKTRAVYARLKYNREVNVQTSTRT